MNLDKVYVVIDNSVWNDEEYSNIICVTTTKDLAKEYLKEYVEKVKQEIDYNNLNFSKEENDEGFVVDENNDFFEIHKTGDYNSNHILISVHEEELIKEKELKREEVENYEL